MSAHLIFDLAPLGSVIRYSDGLPRPPEHHRRKLSTWQNTNGGGRLVRKQAEQRVGNTIIPASITLHEGDHGSRDIIVRRVFRRFSVTSALKFVVAERPAIGAVRVFDRAGKNAELVHLASHRAAAEEWLTRHGYPNAVLDEVTTDVVAADVVEGRAAA